MMFVTVVVSQRFVAARRFVTALRLLVTALRVLHREVTPDGKPPPEASADGE